MPGQKSDAKRDRIPPEFSGLQVNACKNPTCVNFGIPAENSRNDPNYRISGKKRVVREEYVRTGTGAAKSSRVIICKSCKESIPLKNNQAIIETVESLQWSPDNHFCPNLECSNHQGKSLVGLNTSEYVKRGKTATGNQRWKCKACGKSFVVSRARYPASHGAQSHKYVSSIKALLNTVKIKRLMEIQDIDAPVIYHNIERAYRACLRFNREREKNLSNGSLCPKEIFLCTDRQTYLLNWDQREDKRNIAYRSVVTADCTSGYVFPIHVSYDPWVNRDRIHLESWERGDQELTMALRRYSQYWLDDDYQQLSASATTRHETYSQDALKKLRARYADSNMREDVELPSDQVSPESMLPRIGMQFREDYVLYAHFLITRDLLSTCDNIHYFTEQESGIRAAYMAAYGDRVKSGQSELFYVSVKDGATREERERADQLRQRRLKDTQSLLGIGPFEAKWHLVEDTMRSHLNEEGQWKDRWALYPIPTSGEVEKRFSHMTSMPGEDLHEKARIAAHCSMLQVDNFLQMTRRRLSMLERPISSPANAGRKWYGQAPYNPRRPIQLLEILRTYFNYCELGDKKRETPAMRLGLADSTVDLRKILMP